MKLTHLKILCWFTSLPLFAQEPTGNLIGVITDSSGTRIPYANVQLLNTKRGAISNALGIYSVLNIPIGKYQVRVSCVGYKNQEIETAVRKGNNTLNFHLRATLLESESVEVTAEKTEFRQNILSSMHSITPREIQSTPQMMERDVIKTIQTLPGVVTASDNSSRFYIRGGGGDQNLVLLDGIPIYNPFHALGSLSIFDPDLIQSVNLYTGGYPADYSGRLSSVLDIKTRDGTKDRKFLSRSSLSFLSSRVGFEGTINDVSWFVSGRKSLFSRLPGKIRSGEIPLNFYDLIFKGTFDRPGFIKTEVLGLMSQDEINNSNTSEPNYLWKTQAIAVTHYAFIPPNVLGTATLVFSRSSSQRIPQSYSPSTYASSVVQDNLLTTAVSVNLPNQNQYAFGFNLNFPQYSYDFINTGNYHLNYDESNPILNFWTKYIIGRYSSFRAEVGLMSSLLVPLFRNENGPPLEPRLAINYHLNPLTNLKISYGRYYQYLMTVVNEDEILPLFDAWIQVPKNLPPQRVDHYILGLEAIPQEFWNLGVQVYYKYYLDLISPNLQKIDANDPDFVSGTGKAYGTELTVKYQDRTIYAAANYSISRAEKTANGITYFPRYDQRHTFNFLSSYRFWKNWEISARWEINTGQRYSPIAGYYDRLLLGNLLTNQEVFETGKAYIVLGPKNSATLPVYHRLDLSLKKKFKIGGVNISANIDVINVYDRANLFYFNRETGQRINQLPFLPSMGVQVEF